MAAYKIKRNVSMKMDKVANSGNDARLLKLKEFS